MLHDLEEDRAAYLYLIAGGLRLSEGDELSTGDAVKAFGPEALQIRAEQEVELILIEVPGAFERVGVWAR